MKQLDGWGFSGDGVGRVAEHPPYPPYPPNHAPNHAPRKNLRNHEENIAENEDWPDWLIFARLIPVLGMVFGNHVFLSHWRRQANFRIHRDVIIAKNLVLTPAAHASTASADLLRLAATIFSPLGPVVLSCGSLHQAPSCFEPSQCE